MKNLPLYTSFVFACATLLTAWFLFRVSGKSRMLIIIITGWLLLQMFISLTGFYTIANTVPPRLLLLVLPPVAMIIVLFSTVRGRNYIDSLSLRWLTLLHSVRILVELVLFWLCIQKVVPSLITFEGQNFDVFSGITAPVIYYFSFIKGRLHKKLLLAWNIICLVLLINVVVHALLSAPTVFQQFSFDQPTIAILYFPFIWLPGFVVPVVLLAHLAAIRRLLKRDEK